MDGKRIANELLSTVADEVRDITACSSLRPALAVVMLGDNPASANYVRRKLAACRKVGIASREFRLSAMADATALFTLIDRLNADAAIHGLLVQLPLSPHIDANSMRRKWTMPAP